MSHAPAGPAPRVSVILCAYKSGERILPTIRSLLAQTFEDFELVIIDDASGDDTPEIIRRIEDPRIRLIINESNRGVAQSRNTGLEAARAEYIAHCDHDDIWKPDKLRQQVAFMEANPEHGLVGTEFEVFQDGRLIETTSTGRHSSGYLRWLLFQQSVFLHSSTMMRRPVLRAHGLAYPADLDFADDWCLYHQIAKVSKIGMIGEALVEYHLHGRNWSTVAKGAMQARGRSFFARELEARLGRPVPETEVRDYLEAVVEGEGCRDAEAARGVGRLMAAICESFSGDPDLSEEDRRAVRAATADKWYALLKATARRAGPGILALYGQAGLPGWQKLDPWSRIAAYLECAIRSSSRRARCAFSNEGATGR